MEQAYRGHNSTLRCCRLLSAHQSFPLWSHSSYCGCGMWNSMRELETDSLFRQRGLNVTAEVQ